MLTEQRLDSYLTTTSAGTSSSTAKAGQRRLHGQLDDTMLFNYALTPAQIKVLYNQNSAVRFGPQTGTPVERSSGAVRGMRWCLLSFLKHH